MRVAALQETGLVGHDQRNLDTIRDAADRARTAGADLLVTPELFACGYLPGAVHASDGVLHRKRVGEIAADVGMSIVASTVEADGAMAYISASLFDGTGRELTRYRKQNLFDGEHPYFAGGTDDPQIVSVGGFRVALGICFDVEFPEFVRRQAVRGATLMLVPTAVPLRAGTDGSAHPLDTRVLSTRVVPTRALESQMFIVYANHCGPDFSGTSTIADPYGRSLVTAGDHRNLIAAELDPAVVTSARADIGYLRRITERGQPISDVEDRP